jgi:predicted transcriptional regulator
LRGAWDDERISERGEVMTEITINLPDALTRDLQAKADAWKMSLEEVLQEAAAQLMLQEGLALEALDLTPEETKALELANRDLAQGLTINHEEAMTQFRDVLSR